jgi:nucleoside-diphosphate-sugar epimerase
MTPYKSGPKWKVLNYSNDKARRLLHWRPTVDISEGLAVTFAAEREQNRLMGIGA